MRIAFNRNVRIFKNMYLNVKRIIVIRFAMKLVLILLLSSFFTVGKRGFRGVCVCVCVICTNLF